MKSLPFYIPEAWKRYPFRAEPPRIGHYREYLPGDYCLSARVWIMRCSHSVTIWLATAGVLTTRCQHVDNTQDASIIMTGWCFTKPVILISEIRFLEARGNWSFAIASRRRWYPRDSAHRLWKELDISSVLFGKATMSPDKNVWARTNNVWIYLLLANSSNDSRARRHNV